MTRFGNRIQKVSIEEQALVFSSVDTMLFTIPLPCQNLRVEIIKGRGNAA